MFYPTSNIQLRDIHGVGTGNTCIINCPKGPRYRRIILALQDSGVGNTNAPSVASITTGDIQIVLGSKTIRRATGAQIDLVNTINGSQYASYGVAGAANGGGITYLPIFFEEPWRKRADFQNGLSLETGWLDPNGIFQIKIPIAGTTTTPVIGAIAVVDAFSSGKANPIMKWFSDDANTAAATLDLANIFQGAPATDLVESMSLLNTSDGKFVAKARLVLNGQVVIDDQTFDQQTAFLREADMSPTGTSQAGANAYHIVFDHDDLFESLRQVGSISQSQLTLTLSAASAGTLRRITQRLGDPTL
ncbi:MAG: major capsid protein P2 [Limisphaerales bacterium]